MLELAFKLDLMIEGAHALIDSGIRNKFIEISSRGGHLSGKNIDGTEILKCSKISKKGILSL